MKILHYFRHMDSSDALRLDAEQRLEAISSLILESTPVHVTYALEPSGQASVHIGLHARSHNLVEVEERSEDMYKSLDQAVDTLKQTLARDKSKLVGHHPVKLDRFDQQAQAAAAVEPPLEDGDEVFDGEFETVQRPVQQSAPY